MVELTKALWGKLPIFGVGLGCQIIALAAGGSTYKMKHGHNGGNISVIHSGEIKREITSQSHSYAICEDSLAETGLTVTHGICWTTRWKAKEGSKEVLGVQHYPENSWRG